MKEHINRIIKFLSFITTIVFLVYLLEKYEFEQKDRTSLIFLIISTILINAYLIVINFINGR